MDLELILGGAENEFLVVAESIRTRANNTTLLVTTNERKLSAVRDAK